MRNSAPTFVKVFGVNTNQVPLDYRGNRERIKKGIDLVMDTKGGKETPGAIAFFPELDVTGYGCERAFRKPHVIRKGIETIQWIADYLKEMNYDLVIVVGVAVIHRRKTLNCAAVVAPGRILGFVAKKYLARSGRHYEPKWFVPSPEGVEYLTIDGVEYPVGRMLFDISGVKVGVEVCQDAWEINRPALQYALAGMDILGIINASHFSIGKAKRR